MARLSAIDVGGIMVESGGKRNVLKLFGYFDEPVDVGSIRRIVR